MEKMKETERKRKKERERGRERKRGRKRLEENQREKWTFRQTFLPMKEKIPSTVASTLRLQIVQLYFHLPEETLKKTTVLILNI